MTMTDPIADMFTRIRNANQRNYDKVEMPKSKIKQQIADLLAAEGFISAVGIKVREGYDYITLNLKYDEDHPIITGIKRVSKPGLRVYVKCDEIPLVKGGLGVALVSTSQGIMSGRMARKKNIGGELLGLVW